MASDEVKNTNQKQEDKKKILTSPAKYFFGGFIVCILIWGGLLAAYCHFHGSKYHYVEQGAVVAIAVLGACVSLYTAAKQEENVDKWNQKKIDADLKAKARIEWIQRVREATSAFITSCYSMAKLIDLGNKEEQTKAYKNAKENATLLALYFGPDTSGKNQEIVTCIEEILKNYETLPIDGKRMNDIIEAKKEDFKEKIKYWREQAPKKQNGDPDGRTTEYAMFKKYEKELETIDSKYSDIIKWSVGQLDHFNDIIRAYLKEEWKKAKEGK